jgi:hypothetical protein
MIYIFLDDFFCRVSSFSGINNDIIPKINMPPKITIIRMENPKINNPKNIKKRDIQKRSFKQLSIFSSF